MKIIIQTIISDYKNYLINEEKSPVTIEKYVRDVRAFYDWIQDKELTKIAVLEYKTMLIENYAPASVNSILSSLNSFFDYNEWYDLKVKNLKIQQRMFCKSETELSKAEYERLLCAAKDKRNERLYLVMQTICSTGIRVSEIKYITKEAVINGQAQVKLKGKIRTVFIPKELCKILKKFFPHTT